MPDIRSLADELRNNIKGQDALADANKAPPVPSVPAILQEIRKYDNRDHKGLMHIRFNAETIRLLNQFKMATGVDVTKLVAFSVDHLLRQHPEIKSIIKHYLQQLEL